MKNKTSLAIALAFTATLLLPLHADAAATIVIINQDPAGVGFNDTTPATPVGGNTGTTVGQQRLIAFERAAQVWGQTLDSDVVIRIEAKFGPLECSANEGVLGQAGPIAIESDHPGAPETNTWYHIAMANRQAGEDRDPTGNDIRASFNGDLGKPNCLSGASWYYGLDSNEPNGGVDLVVVLIHEFAHGLGFGEFLDEDGSYFMGIPDTYSRRLFDNVSQLAFVDMNLTQRGTALTSGNLVWTGPAVFAAAPSFLNLAPGLKVSSPASVTGGYAVGTAEFGRPPSAGPFSGQLVQAQDPSDSNGSLTTDGCSTLTNPGEVAGKLAMIDRGTCTFVIKATNAQAAGAIGVVIVDNVAANLPPGMAGTDPSITIPIVSITMADGSKLKAALGEGVQAEIGVGPGLAGSDGSGRPKVYAPSPFAPGSSTSHWDTTATPNLLMEPFINADLDGSLDLTVAQFTDVGWFSPANVNVDLTNRLTGSQTPPAKPGDSLRYELQINQTGGAAATSTRLTTALDSNVTLVAGSVQASKGTIVKGNQSGDRTVEIAIGGLKPNASMTAQFDVTVNESLPPGVEKVSSSATVSGTNVAPVTKSSDTTLDVNPMKATKTAALLTDADQSGSITRGDTVRYQINLGNTGDTALTSVVVNDELDANLSVVQILSTSSGTVTQGSEPGAKKVVWEVPLVAGGTESLIFDVLVAESTPTNVTYILNQAAITGTGFNPTVSDNPETNAALDATSFGLELKRKRTTRR